MSLFDLFRERPLLPGQDPWVVVHDGWMYLIQSVAGDRKIVVRKFRALASMDRVEEKVVWAPKGGDHDRELWAPELHQLDGRWYVYYAASDGDNANHRMYVLEADEPMGPYREVGRVADPDHDVWAIDLTVFTHDGQLYGAWSGWEGIDDGFPQNLYVAPMSDPATISGERCCISRPEHDWELSVAPINEGPEPLRNPDTGQLFLMYSADASWTQAYKIGVLELVGDDVVDPASWRKLPGPLFTGGGHGCVVDTADGQQLVYHRKLSADPGWADREIRWAPLGWDEAGLPVVRRNAPASGAGAPARAFPEGVSRVA